jgi:hypothetical protein
MALTRDDLWVRDIVEKEGEWVVVDHPCSPAEFDFIARKDGYVRLDVDVEDLRAGIDLHGKDYHSDPVLIGRYLRLARAVLDAHDPEGDN